MRPNAPFSLAKVLYYPLEQGEDFLTNNMLVSLREMLDLGFSGSALFFLSVPVTAAIAEVLQVGIQWNPAPLSFQLSRLNPMKGIRRILGWRSTQGGGPPLDTVGEMLWILMIFSCGSALLIQQLWGVLHAGWLSGQPLGATEYLGLHHELIKMAGAGVAIGTLAGIAEWLFARWRLVKRLRMDREELKRELRESDGDPELRGMRKHLHQELLAHGTLEGVRRAKVVISSGAR